MTISYPLAESAFWEQMRFAGRPEFALQHYRKQAQDGGGNTRSASFGVPKWSVAVVLEGGRHDRNLAQESDIKHLDGRDGTFLAYDIRQPYPDFDPTGSMLDSGSVVEIGGEAAFGDTTTGTYRYEGGSVTLTQAVTVDSDAGTYWDANGVLQTASADVVRLDFGPFANYLRNFLASGAAAGSPGTMPTSWAISTPTGLTRTISLETINGVACVRITLAGTASSTAAIQITTELITTIRAALGQDWTHSQFTQIVRGTGLSGNDWRLEFWEYSSASGFLATGTGTAISSTTVETALTQRSVSRAVGDASAFYLRPMFRTTSSITSGTVCDIEIIIGIPLMNRGLTALAWPRVPLGVWAETAFTNRVTRSREFDNAAWSKLRTTVTANVAGITDPWGTALADKVVEDGTAAATHIIYQAYTTTNYVNHVGYVIAKAAERTKIRLHLANFTTDQCTATFDLVAGTVSSVSSGTTDFTGASAFITSLGHGWYWCEIEALKTSGDTDCNLVVNLCDASGSETYNGDGTSGIYLAHGQMEEGTAGHMPLVTTTVAIARAGDQPTFKAKGRNDWTYTRDNGTTGTYPDITGDLLPNINILSRPYFKAWVTIRDTQPSASAVQVKSKGSNNRSIALKGLPPFFRITKSDKLSILYSSTKRFLFEAMETVTADINGETVEFEIQPFMPSGIAVNDAVTLKKPCGKFKLIAGSYRPSSGRGNISDGVSFSIISTP